MTEAGTHEHEPHIKVVRGNPTDEELAAVVAVLGGTGGCYAETTPQERNRWGNRIDELRYSIFSFQRVTLQLRSHLRR